MSNAVERHPDREEPDEEQGARTPSRRATPENTQIAIQTRLNATENSADQGRRFRNSGNLIWNPVTNSSTA